MVRKHIKILFQWLWFVLDSCEIWFHDSNNNKKKPYTQQLYYSVKYNVRVRDRAGGTKRRSWIDNREPPNIFDSVSNSFHFIQQKGRQNHKHTHITYIHSWVKWLVAGVVHVSCTKHEIDLVEIIKSIVDVLLSIQLFRDGFYIISFLQCWLSSFYALCVHKPSIQPFNHPIIQPTHLYTYIYIYRQTDLSFRSMRMIFVMDDCSFSSVLVLYLRHGFLSPGEFNWWH